MKLGSTKHGWTLKYAAYVQPTTSENNPPAPTFDNGKRKWMSLPPRKVDRGTIYTTVVGVAKPSGSGLILKDRGHVKVEKGTYRERGTW